MKDVSKYYPSGVPDIQASMDLLQSTLEKTFGTPPHQLKVKHDVSWVMDGNIPKEDLLKIAKEIAEQGMVVTQGGREIYPPKRKAPPALPGVTFTSHTRVGD